VGRLEALIAQTVNAENGHRGYVVTADETFLEPYLHVRGAIPAEMEQLRTLIADNPAQQLRLDALGK